jgi:MFS transporter, FSR family, fosmidomycin resistance protein
VSPLESAFAREQPPPPQPTSQAGESSAVRSFGVGLSALAVGHFAIDCCTGIWPVYKTLAGLDLVKAGVIATACSVLGNGLQVASGMLADRGFARALLVGGALLVGAVTLAPFTSSYLVLFLLVLATMVGSAAFHPAGAGSASQLSRNRTGVVVAVFLIGGQIGYSLSQLLFTAAYRSAHRATAFILVIPLLAAIGLARSVPAAARAPQSLAAWSRSIHGAWRRLIPLFAVQVFAATISNSLIFLLPDFLASRGASPWVVGGGGHLSLVMGTALALLPAGHAADRFGARRVLVVTALLSGLLLAAILRFDLPAAVLLVMVAAFGAFNNVSTVVVVSEGNRMLPGQASGVSALLMGLPWCVAAFGPVIAATLADPSRGGAPNRALTWLWLCIPATVCSCWFVPRRSAQSAAGG